MRPNLLVLAIVAIGCGCARIPTDPARSAAYKADREACGTSVPDAVDKRNAKTGLAWFASPVTRWFQIDAGIAACLGEKGWTGAPRAAS